MLSWAVWAWDAIRSWFGTQASAHRPFLARGQGRYRLWHWHPNGSRRGTAIVFATARAIQPAGEDAWDQFSPRPSRRGKTKSFGGVERVRWSSSAESGSPCDRTIGGRGPRAGSLGQVQGEQTTRQ